MRKLALFVMLCTFSFTFAALVIDVPFDQDIIGPAFSANGSYVYETEWITMTNASNETETFSINFTYANLPVDWTFEVGNSAFMFQPNFDNPVLLGPGDSEQIYAVVNVESAGGFNFTITFDEAGGGGDREDPIVVDFTFNTADSVGVDPNNQIVANPITLEQNYPNPFNPTTTISFELDSETAENTELIICNLKGQKIKTFSNLQISQSPNQQVTWNGTDDSGKPVSSGIYYYTLKNGAFQLTKKMILLK